MFGLSIHSFTEIYAFVVSMKVEFYPFRRYRGKSAQYKSEILCSRFHCTYQLSLARYMNFWRLNKTLETANNADYSRYLRLNLATIKSVSLVTFWGFSFHMGENMTSINKFEERKWKMKVRPGLDISSTLKVISRRRDEQIIFYSFQAK